MLFPHRLIEHRVLVARDVCRLARSAEIEDHRDGYLALRLPEIAREQPTYIFGERDAELCGFGLGAPLRVGIKGDLSTSIHRAMVPSPAWEGNGADVS